MRQLLPICRLIHSVASDSALAQLDRHGEPGTEVLVEVNVAGEAGRSGVDRSRSRGLHQAVSGAGGRSDDDAAVQPGPRGIRPHFARLAELAAAHGLARLSMGTSQDWRVAVEEGATIIRLGTALYV